MLPLVRSANQPANFTGYFSGIFEARLSARVLHDLGRAFRLAHLLAALAALLPLLEDKIQPLMSPQTHSSHLHNRAVHRHPNFFNLLAHPLSDGALGRFLQNP